MLGTDTSSSSRPVSSSSFAMALTWQVLPSELRAMILEMLLQPESGSIKSTMSRYSAVSNEFRAFVEARLFHRLILHQSCIGSFGAIIRGHRRHLVKHIWLRVQLPLYGCRACEWYESSDESSKNNIVFTDALCRMLQVLSSWSRDGHFGLAGAGPVLELSMHSPSDSEHFFPDYRLDPHVYPRALDEDCTYQEYKRQLSCTRAQPRASQTRHDFLEGPASASAPDTAMLRVFGNSILLDFGILGPVETKKLPVAEAVKGLLVRRQHLRGLHPETLCMVLQSLPGVESIAFEHWRQIHPRLEHSKYHGKRAWLSFAHHIAAYQARLAQCLRVANAAKSISLFEDHDLLFHKQGERELLPLLGTTLADESCSLEHLSVAFVADAKDFFQDYWPGRSPTEWDLSRSGVHRALISCLPLNERRAFAQYRRPEESASFGERLWKSVTQACGDPPCPMYKPRWAKLETLALTSQLLQPAAEEGPITNLLEAAGGAALAMPRLRTMEIWNGARGLGCVFRYRRVGTEAYPTITLSSTWSVELDPRVCKAWEDVASGHTGCNLVVEVRALAGEGIKFHGSVAEFLDLRHRTLHPVSLCQLMWEGERHDLRR